MLQIRLRSALPIVVILMAIMLLSTFQGCAVNMATGKRQFNLISESQEIAMGREAHQSITASMGRYPNHALQTYTSDLGLNLASRSERPGLPWSFTVIDDPAVNAFALPGGFIYVTRGILAHLENEAELVGVIGHEIGHVTGKHSVTRLSKTQLTQIGIGIGVQLDSRLEKFGQIASAGLGLLFLKFSRSDETEADELGLRYLQRTDHDPRQMVGVMTMLDDVTTAATGGARSPEWLATHPNPGNRRRNIQTHIDAIPFLSPDAIVGRDRFLSKIDGLAYGADPRQGFFDGNHFYHPEMKFQIDFPFGWKTANQATAVIGVNPSEDAIFRLTTSSETSPQQAASNFFSQEGITELSRTSIQINRLKAVYGRFRLISGESAISGSVYFIPYDGKLFMLLGYAQTADWKNYSPTIDHAARSFQPLTDPAILSAQPMRLKIRTIAKNQSIEQFYRTLDSPVSIDRIRLINRLKPGEMLSSGEKIKTITGKSYP